MTVQLTLPGYNGPKSTSQNDLIRRALTGGKASDFSRAPRYLAVAALGATLIWAPLVGYLQNAPLSYRSTTSLILPGSGASASMNLNGIGQASSYASSAFASNAVSPTETYKRLLGADRIVAAAASSMGTDRKGLGQPRVRLVDQTSLIHVEMTGRTPEEAQARGDALLTAFFEELDALRTDEVDTREDSGLQAIEEYRDSVSTTRTRIEHLQNTTGLLSVEQYDVLVDRHLALGQQLNEQRASVNERQAAVRALEAQLGIDAHAAAATLKLFADSSYIALLAEVARTQVALAEVNATYGASHPRVVNARSAMQEATRAALALAGEVSGLDLETLKSLDLAPQGVRADLLAELVRKQSDLAGAEEQLATLEEQSDLSQAQLDVFAPAAAELQDLERDFSVAEAVFASAIARAQSSKSDVYASYPLVQVLENPSLPTEPSSPNRKMAVLAGIAATFMMFIALVMGWVRNAVISRLLKKPAAAE